MHLLKSKVGVISSLRHCPSRCSDGFSKSHCPGLDHPGERHLLEFNGVFNISCVGSISQLDGGRNVCSFKFFVNQFIWGGPWLVPTLESTVLSPGVVSTFVD